MVGVPLTGPEALIFTPGGRPVAVKVSARFLLSVALICRPENG